MKELLTTTGRVPRSTFWAVFGCIYGLLLLLGAVLQNVKLPEWGEALIGLSVLPVLILALIVQIKRWQDLNKTGWWVLINIIPLFGGLWTLIECGFIRGTQGTNRFGPDPLIKSPPPLPPRIPPPLPLRSPPPLPPR